MRPYGLLTSFCLVSGVVSQSISELLQNVTKAFPDYNVVPGVVESFKPSAYVNMMFTDSSGRSVTPGSGQVLTMEQTHNEPEYSLIAVNGTSDDSAFGPLVLIMVDPDAPTPQNTSLSQIIHFLGTNFTLGSSGTMLSNGTEAYMWYWWPLPEAGSDPHRYVLLVYPEPPNFQASLENYFAGKGDVKIPWSPARMGFNLTDFAEKTNLGEPIAGNFFITGPDSTTTATGTATVASSATSSTGLPSGTPLTASAVGDRETALAAGMNIFGLSLAALLFTLA